MKLIEKIATVAAVLAMGQAVCTAQNLIDLRITEAAPDGDSTVVDDYGRHGGWIEIQNISQGTVNYGGCYLTDDRSSLRKSLIPGSDKRTSLKPRQVVLFHASGRGSDGTFYAGFRLHRGSDIYLVANDGRTVLDSLHIPEDLPEGMSVSKYALDDKQIQYDSIAFSVPSPMVQNGSDDGESASDRMKRIDPHGFVLTVVAVSVVFAALAILWFFFWFLFDRKPKKEGVKSGFMSKTVPAKGGLDPEAAATVAMALDLQGSGEDYAAVAMAMHLYLSESVHDAESFVVTIRHKDSPWDDKSRSFRRMPR